jgi:HK97 family phage prohead protease
MYDDFGPYEEVVATSAFSETLAAQPDVAFLVNHRGVTMARTTNDTLQLSLTGMGLQSDAWLNPKRQDVKDLVIAIEDRNIDQMSFAFRLDEGWWNDDFTQFKITKLDIDRGDVSAVNYGANPYTSIAARSLEILDDLEHLPAGAKRAALARLAGPQDAAPVRAPEQDPNGMDLAHLSAWLLQNQ